VSACQTVKVEIIDLRHSLPRTIRECLADRWASLMSCQGIYAFGLNPLLRTGCGRIRGAKA